MSLKNWPELNLVNNYFETKENIIVGPFKSTKLLTVNNIKIFECTKSNELYDIYGCHVYVENNRFHSHSRRKKTTIKRQLLSPKINQQTGRGNRDDVNENNSPNDKKTKIVIMDLDGDVVNPKDFKEVTGIDIDDIISSIKNKSKLKGTILENFQSKNIEITNHDEYVIKLLKPNNINFKIDYDKLETLCNCAECQTVQATLKNGIQTNVVTIIHRLYEYLTIGFGIDKKLLIPIPELDRLPVAFHHLYVQYLTEKFKELTNCDAQELDKLLDDYDPGKYHEIINENVSAETALKNYNIVSKKYIDKYNDNSYKSLYKRLKIINKQLIRLFSSHNIDVVININDVENQPINNYKISMIEKFLEHFIETAPQYLIKVKLTLNFDFGLDIFNDDSFVVVNRNPNKNLFSSYMVNFYSLLETLQDLKNQENLSKEKLIVDIETDNKTLFVEKKPYEKTIITNKKEIDIVEATKDWFNKNNLPIEDKFILPDWAVIFNNKYDITKFVGFKTFSDFVFALIYGLPNKLTINETRYFPVQTRNILNVLIQLINNNSISFDFIVTKTLNTFILEIKSSNSRK